MALNFSKPSIHLPQPEPLQYRHPTGDPPVVAFAQRHFGPRHCARYPLLEEAMSIRQKALIASAAAVALAVVGGLAILALRPALVMGAGEDALSHSVQGEIGAPGREGRCESRDDGNWSCSVTFVGDTSSPGYGVDYEVVADAFGCWHAVRASDSRTRGEAPRRAEGCIYLWDY